MGGIPTSMRITFLFLPLLILVSCGEDPAMEREAKSDEPRKKASPEEVPSVAAEPISDEELEDKLDALFPENAGFDDFAKMIQLPEISKIMQEMGEPSDEIAERMEAAMKLLMAAKVYGENEANGGTSIMLNDPTVLRKLLRFALKKDPDGYYSAFCEAIEESAAHSAIDPDADTALKVLPETVPVSPGETDPTEQP